MVHYPISRFTAVQIIEHIAKTYGITDAFDLFDDEMIDYKMAVLAKRMQDPRDNRGNVQSAVWFWFRIVESELGIEPHDSREIREYAQYLSEGV